MKKKFFNFISIFIPFFLFFLVLEIILRFTSLSPYEVPVYPYDYFEKNEKYGHDIKKNSKKKKFSSSEYNFDIWSNEIGCFDYSIKNLEDGYIYIAGASVSWGFVPLEKNFGSVLEKKLNKRVLKCGVPGHSTKQKYYKTLNVIETLKKKPELIIFVYGFPQDLKGDYLFPQYKVENNIFTTNKIISSYENGDVLMIEEKKRTLSKKIKYILSQKSYVFRLSHLLHTNLRKKLRKLRKKDKNEIEKRNVSLLNSVGGAISLSYFDEKKITWLKTVWVEHLNTIKSFKEAAEKNNSKFLVIFWDDLPDYTATMLEFGFANNLPFVLDNNKKVLNFLEKENINYLNISEKMFEHVGYTSILDKRNLLKGKLIYNNNNHPNIEGNKFIAEKIIEKLN